MTYLQQQEIDADAKRFAADWYARGDPGRSEEMLALFVKHLLNGTHTSAVASERERVAEKFASLLLSL